jgi:ADP-ribose pyrophosphatase YjhB (NUDIX family)
MQFRFDGCFGFPGGFMDIGEEVVAGLSREMEEETNVEFKGELELQKSHWVCSSTSNRPGTGAHVVNHFFALQVSEEKFSEIFCRATERMFSDLNKDGEVLGHVKVPLYTMKERNHKDRGFPAFLSGLFVGCARAQLLVALVKTGLMTQAEIDEAILKCKDTFEIAAAGSAES